MCMSPRLVACQGVTSDVCSEICPYVDHEYPPPKSSESAPDLGEGYGVAIGTYDSLHDDCRRFGTEAVKLNLAVLRATCGKDIKILVCDDASPSASQRCYRRLCEEYGAEFSTNQERMGHTSGDMIVFHKAIHWARQHRLKTVTKLSHRMVIDARNWLQEDSQQLLASGFATQAQMFNNYGGEQIRTECVMMVASRWFSSMVLEHYRPRRIPFWNESHTFVAISEIVDPERPYPHFLPWKRISFFRGADQPPVFFRDMPEADVRFRELAAKHGIHLTSSFSTVDSCATMEYI